MKGKLEAKVEQSSTVKQVQLRSVPRHVLNAFDNLVPDNAPGQAKAAVVILKHVDQQIGNQSGSILHEDVVYIVKRLISGLVSNRQRVREGFCSALQGLLQLQPSTVSLTYKSIKDLCLKKGKLSQVEQRDFHTGELLGYGALIRAGHVKSNTTMRQEIVERLFAIRQQKLYFDIIVSNFLVHMMEKLPKTVVYQEILVVLIPELSVPIETLTPSKLWLRLVIFRKYPEYAPEEFAGTLKAKNFSTIASIIVKTAINMPSVHPCLSEVISSLAVPKKSTGELPVIQFWSLGLAPYLEKPTTNCLQLLFIALQLILLKLKTAEEIHKVCNEFVITHLLNVMSLHDKNLSASARGVGSALLQLATANYEEDNSVQLAVAKVLIEKPGNIRFDQLTGTKLLGQMRMHFTPDTIKSISGIIKNIVDDDTGEIRSSDKIGAAFFLGKLISQPRMSAAEHEGWKKQQILLLMSLALLKPDIKANLDEYQDVFFRCLSSQMSRIKEYKVMLEYLHDEANKAIVESKESSLLPSEVQSTWQKIISRLNEMKEGDKLPPVALDVFQVMYTQMSLYLLATAETKEIIDELDCCYKEAKKGKKKVSTNSDGEVIYKTSWVDKVVELLLTFLPHENSLFRSLAQGVFWLLCPLMTPAALASIVDVLDPAKQDDLIRLDDGEEQEEEDEDEDSSEGSEEEDSEDDEDIEDEEEEEDDTEMDEDLSEEEDESDNEEDKVLTKLRKQMLALTGGAEDEVDMDSASQEELDNIDEKLGSLVGDYLKHKRTNTLKYKGMEKLQSDERLLMHFRSRVCDLLELYLKESPDMGLVLSVINPLMTALVGIDQDRKRQEELLCRIRSLLFMVGKIQKFASNGNATIELVVEEFNNFFSSAVKMRDEYNPIIRGCYQLFLRCGCQLLGEEAHDPNNMLMQSYLSHLREIFTQNKFNLRTNTFTDICLTDCGALWSVVDLMTTFAFNGKFKCYWRTQAMQILYKLYRNESLLARQDRKIITAWEKFLSANICEILTSAPVRDIKGQYVSELCGLLFMIFKKESSTKIESGINWEEVGSVLVSLRPLITSQTYKICRGPYNNIIIKLGLSNLVAKASQEKKKKANASNDTHGSDVNGVILESQDEKPKKKKKPKQKGQGDAHNIDVNGVVLNSQDEEPKKKKKQKAQGGVPMESDEKKGTKRKNSKKTVINGDIIEKAISNISQPKKKQKNVQRESI